MKYSVNKPRAMHCIFLAIVICSLVHSRALHRLTLADDPALKTLGELLVRFLRERDEDIFVSGTMQSMNDIWSQLEKKSKEIGEMLPPKKEFEKMFGAYQDQIKQSARGVLDQAERLGINFTNADLQLKEFACTEFRRPMSLIRKGKLSGPAIHSTTRLPRWCNHV